MQSNMTLLMWEIIAGRVKSVKLLLDCKADVEADNNVIGGRGMGRACDIVGLGVWGVFRARVLQNKGHGLVSTVCVGSLVYTGWRHADDGSMRTRI